MKKLFLTSAIFFLSVTAIMAQETTNSKDKATTPVAHHDQLKQPVTVFHGMDHTIFIEELGVETRAASLSQPAVQKTNSLKKTNRIAAKERAGPQKSAVSKPEPTK